MRRFDVVCDWEMSVVFLDGHFQTTTQRWRHLADYDSGQHITALKQDVVDFDSDNVRVGTSHILRSVICTQERKAYYDLARGVKEAKHFPPEELLCLSDVLEVRLIGLDAYQHNYANDDDSFKVRSAGLLNMPLFKLEETTGTDVIFQVPYNEITPWYRFRLSLKTRCPCRVETLETNGELYHQMDIEWKEINEVFVPIECRRKYKSSAYFGEQLKRGMAAEVIRFRWLKCNEPIDFTMFASESISDPKKLQIFLKPDP